MLVFAHPEQFKHVYWIGGSPCSGKSSISRMLADQFALKLFSVDSAYDQHASRFNPQRHPCLTNWQRMTWEERWMRSMDELLREVIGCYGEHFSFILEDVLASGADQVLLVEGSALLPDLVAEVIPQPRNALWIVPSPDFQRLHYSQRTWARDILAACKQPEVAFANWMERDVRFAGWVAGRVQELGLNLLTVDGSRTIAQNAAWVAAQFQF